MYANEKWSMDLPLLISKLSVMKVYLTIRTSHRDFYGTTISWNNDSSSISVLIIDRGSTLINPSNIGIHSFIISALVIDSEQ